MRISSIELTKFLCHKGPIKFELGPNVTLLTGSNGVGKSALLESIIWAIWGALPQRPARIEGTRALLKCGSAFQIDRSFNGKSEVVDIGQGAGGKRRSEEAIEALFGNYASWNRSLYVTGENVAAFSTGSQALRWDHLEKVTGATKFKDLHKIGSDQAKANTKELTELGAAYDKLTNRLEGFESSYRYAHASRRFIADAVNEPKLKEDLRVQEELLNSAQEELQFLEQTLEDFEDEIRPLQRERESLEAALDKVVYKLCEACGSRVPTEKDKTSLLERLAAVKSEVGKVLEVRQHIRDEVLTLSGRVRDCHPICRDIKATLQELAQREQLLAEVEESSCKELLQILKLRQDVDALFKQVDLRNQEQTLFANVVSSLAPSGAPRRYIRQYLSRIEQFANHYLELMSSPIRIELTTGADGKTLGIKTSGIPATCYEHASGGQRRRIDLCLLLAMAEAAAEVGTIPKDAPLVFDEALDTLDAEGVESLIFLACDIATRRQVLLVSHADPSLPLGSEVHRINLGSNLWTPSMSV